MLCYVGCVIRLGSLCLALDRGALASTAVAGAGLQRSRYAHREQVADGSGCRNM
jgi:hypothetical protein